MSDPYFVSLYDKFKSGTSARYKIYDGVDTPGFKSVYPTALASPEMLAQLPLIDFSKKIAGEKKYLKLCRQSEIWKWDLHAGVGSSVSRKTYLARVSGRAESAITLGAKGIDLLADEAHGVSIAEFRVRQTLFDLKQGFFGEVFFQNVVGEETEKSGLELWKKLAPELKKNSNAKLHSTIVQPKQLTLDEEGNLSPDHQAPGGHGYQSRQALEAALDPKLRPHVQAGRALIAWMSNGEDASAIDPYIVGQVIDTQAPISILFTEKTDLDRKGGMPALVPEEWGFSATVFETAQAVGAGQLKLYEELGMRPGDSPALASTNVTIIHYDSLIPRLEVLLADLEKETGSRARAISELFKIASPDVILNPKTVSGRKFTQLEGTMGSMWFNLDREMRRRYKKPLVQLISIAKEKRTQFFLPVKFAQDYWLQYHSDRFKVDLTSFRLIDQRAGKNLPSLSLEDEAGDHQFYHDVENVLRAFEGTSVIDLKSLKIHRKVKLGRTTLRGDVEIPAR